MGHILSFSGSYASAGDDFHKRRPSNPTRHTAHNSAIDCSLNADGSYIVRYSADGWQLDGQLPQPMGAVQSVSDEDKVGRFHSRAINFSSGARRAEIRVYDSRPTVEFSDQWVSGAITRLLFRPSHMFQSSKIICPSKQSTLASISSAS